MDRILDGEDFAHDHEFMNFEVFLKGFGEHEKRLNRKSTLKSWGGAKCGGPQVYAYISGGRWLGRCWCGSVGYVSRTLPVFFCLACGNEPTGGAAVPVVFPAEADEIERLLVARMVQSGPSEHATAAARTAIPLTLPREWFPGQSVEFLAQQNAEMGVG